jgi:ABC-type multidrug transport system fused ATPase/permease subunit
MPEVTKIIISQKISSIMNANKIYVLDKGKIIAEGKHNELIKTNPLYESLCNIQNVSGVENGK